MELTPEKKLLEAILRQAIKDYIRLNPDSNAGSAEFFENESEDYKSAELFIFGGGSIKFGDWDLNLDDACSLLDISPKRVKKYIYQNQIEY